MSRESTASRHGRRRSTIEARGRGLNACGADDAVRLYRDSNHVSHIAKTLSISRTSVYRALDQASIDGRGNGRRVAAGAIRQSLHD